MSGSVYFIVCEPLEAVKIGFTRKHPRDRLATLQTGSPAPLKLLLSFPGTQEDERRLHQAFAPLHIRLEWFRFEGKLFDMASYIVEGDGDEVPREKFENSLHDVLMQGLWYPGDSLTADEYAETGDWRPFRQLIWEEFGPWDDDL